VPRMVTFEARRERVLDLEAHGPIEPKGVADSVRLVRAASS
jgi:hypothetical protein